MSATLLAEGGFAVSVFTVDDPSEESRFPDLARVHFGAETPLLNARTESGVLRGVRDGKASIGVLPVPADAMSGDVAVSAEPWWLTLAVSDEERPMIVARLPWLASGKNAAAETNALVVAMTRPSPSGDDVSYVAVESSDTISRDRIRSALAVAGIAVTGSGRLARRERRAGPLAAHRNRWLRRRRRRAAAGICRAVGQGCRAHRGAGQLPEAAGAPDRPLTRAGHNHAGPPHPPPRDHGDFALRRRALDRRRPRQHH